MLGPIHIALQLSVTGIHQDTVYIGTTSVYIYVPDVKVTDGWNAMWDLSQNKKAQPIHTLHAAINVCSSPVLLEPFFMDLIIMIYIISYQYDIYNQITFLVVWWSCIQRLPFQQENMPMADGIQLVLFFFLVHSSHKITQSIGDSPMKIDTG